MSFHPTCNDLKTKNLLCNVRYVSGARRSTSHWKPLPIPSNPDRQNAKTSEHQSRKSAGLRQTDTPYNGLSGKLLPFRCSPPVPGTCRQPGLAFRHSAKASLLLEAFDCSCTASYHADRGQTRLGVLCKRRAWYSMEPSQEEPISDVDERPTALKGKHCKHLRVAC